MNGFRDRELEPKGAAYYRRRIPPPRHLEEQYRIGGYLNLARYRFWQMSVRRAGAGFEIVAFRSKPVDGSLERIGPWPIAEAADEAEVRAAVLAMIVATDGLAAGSYLTWSETPPGRE